MIKQTTKTRKVQDLVGKELNNKQNLQMKVEIFHQKLLIETNHMLKHSMQINQTGKCIRQFAGNYAYCRYFINRKW